MPNPRRVRDAIIGISEEIASAKPKEPPVPKPKDTTLATVLEQLAKEKTPPKLPDADENYPPLKNSERFRGPRRTFGGFLRVPCNVRYLSGEYTVKYVQRSQYVLLRNLTPFILLFFLVFLIALVLPSIGLVSGAFLSYWWGLSIFGLASILMAILLIYLNYVDDV